MAKRLDANKLVANVDKLAAEIKNLNTELRETVSILSKDVAALKKKSKTQSDVSGKTKKLTDVQKKLQQVQKASNKVTLETVRATENLRRKRKALTDQVKKEQGTFKKSGGLFRSMTKSILAAGAAFFGARAIIAGLKKAVVILKDFEKAMSKVKAITNATDKEFKALRKDALRLGSTTSKTATQVAELQVEFAKLGFSTTEILAATDATIQLSIAAGTDLADAAVVAASTVRGFGLSAAETQRVVDVMAKSFSSSALDLEKFKTIMATVAPVAKSSGKSLEFATAQAAILADAGLDASTAGTSLRNMFLELNKQGLTWEQGLEKINKSTNKNVTALDLFGKRGATAALILADNTEKTGELKIALDEAAGSAKDMADVMEDNLSGEIDRTKSKWEGFIQSLEDGQGGLATTSRALVKLWGRVAEGFEILATGQEAFLAKQLEEIYNEDVNKRVAEGLKLAKEQIGVDQAILELQEDRAFNLRQINELQQQILELSDKGADKKQKQILKAELIETKALVRILETTIQSEEDAKNAAIEAAAEAARVKEEIAKASAKKTAEEQAKIDEEVYNERAKSFQDFVNKREAEDSAADKALIDRKQQELVDSLKDQEDAIAEFYLKKDELRKEDAEKELEAITSAVEQTGALAQELFNFSNSLRQSEIEGVERQRDAEIAAAEKTGADTAKIEAKFARKEARLRTEQAKADRRQALFNIAINTATGVLKAISLFGPPPSPLGIAGIAFAIATGAIQTAAVLAKPLPKFKEGEINISGKSHTQGGVMAEIEGGESVINRMGTKNAPELLEDINKGLIKDSDLLPNANKMFSGADNKELAQQHKANIINVDKLVKEQQLTRKAVEKQKIITYTPDYILISNQKATEHQKYIDHYYGKKL